jgi:Raf kinase inhibitor-like YbhB/YbcL family protein
MQSTAGAKPILVAVALIGAVSLQASCQKKDEAAPPRDSTQSTPAQSTPARKIPSTIKLQTAAFRDGALLPPEYSCAGAGASPPLSWSGVPAQTKSLALLVTDPDAPGGVWTHWIMWNLPPTTRSLPAHVTAQTALPSGARQGRNSRGGIGYDPPCPPPGKPHHYIFTLYALDSKIVGRGPKASNDAATLRAYAAALRAQAIGQGQITARFGR